MQSHVADGRPTEKTKQTTRSHLGDRAPNVTTRQIQRRRLNLIQWGLLGQCATNIRASGIWQLPGVTSWSMPLPGGELMNDKNVRQESQGIEYRRKKMLKETRTQTEPLTMQNEIALWRAGMRQNIRSEDFGYQDFSIGDSQRLHRRRRSCSRWASVQ